MPPQGPSDAELDPGNRIKIFDTTLRDGEQSPGIALNAAEKVTIAQQLEKLGVDIIEAGFPINSKGEFDAVRQIARSVGEPVVTALARTHTGDINRAAEAIADAERPRIHTFISTSDIHIKHQLQTDREDVLGQAKAGVARASDLMGDRGEVEFSPMDATRADRDYTAEVIATAIEQGADVINIPDTVGYATPEEYRQLIEFFRREVGRPGVEWSVHCHNDLGLAVANSYAGIQGGARQVEGSINGIGERAGNVALEEIIMLIKTRGGEEGFYTTVNTEELGPTGRLVSRLTGYDIPPNKPINGRNVFAHESGIHQDGALKERTTYEIMDPEDVGWEGEQIIPGKHSGRHGIESLLEKMPGYDGNKRVVDKTFSLFKGFRDNRGTVSMEQLVEIHEEAKRRIASGYEIHSYEVTASDDFKVGKVTLIHEDGRHTNGEATYDPKQADDASEEARIDGSVAAIISAVAAANGTDYEVESARHVSVGTGKAAIDKATVEIRINGETVIGRGLSTDTVKAAALAYLDACKRAEGIQAAKNNV